MLNRGQAGRATLVPMLRATARMLGWTTRSGAVALDAANDRNDLTGCRYKGAGLFWSNEYRVSNEPVPLGVQGCLGGAERPHTAITPEFAPSPFRKRRRAAKLQRKS